MKTSLLERALLAILILIFGVGMAAIIGLICVAIVAPSCSDKGGHNVVAGRTVQLMIVGKVLIPQTITIYKCVIDSK